MDKEFLIQCVLLQGFLIVAVFSQVPQLTPDQINVVQQALQTLLKLNMSGNPTQEQIEEVAAAILTNPVIADLIRQYGIADSQNAQGSSILLAAASAGNLQLVQVILNAEANINLIDSNSWTALHYATSKNHTEVAIFLITVGINVNVKNTNFGQTALFWSASLGNLEITKALLKAGAEINIQDANGNTPLIIAVSQQRLEIVNYLIEQGAHVDIKNNFGYTALITAADNGHYNLVTVLLSANANPNIRTNYDDVAIGFAANEGYSDIVRELMARGADLDIANTLGLTPLTLAVRGNQLDNARLLLSSGADINKQAFDGGTALMDAVNFGYSDMVKLLLEHCPDLSLTNRNGKTAMNIALSRQIQDTIKMIQEHSNTVCGHKGLVYDNGDTRYDSCREVQCCHSVWSPTGRILETCGSKCRTILAPTGACTNINKCPRLFAQAQWMIDANPDNVRAGYLFVEGYGCGVSGGDVRVCCPTADI